MLAYVMYDAVTAIIRSKTKALTCYVPVVFVICHGRLPNYKQVGFISNQIYQPSLIFRGMGDMNKPHYGGYANDPMS